MRIILTIETNEEIFVFCSVLFRTRETKRNTSFWEVFLFVFVSARTQHRFATQLQTSFDRRSTSFRLRTQNEVVLRTNDVMLRINDVG